MLSIANDCGVVGVPVNMLIGQVWRALLTIWFVCVAAACTWSSTPGSLSEACATMAWRSALAFLRALKFRRKVSSQ